MGIKSANTTAEISSPTEASDPNLFDTLSYNGGKFSEKAFIDFLMSQKLGLTKEQASNMFKFADKDGKGDLDASEIKFICAAVANHTMSVPVRIIVPSTQDVSGKISKEEMTKRCDQVLEILSHLFGGATASGLQRGAYRAETGKIVYEDVKSVTSFCTKELWKENVGQVRAKVADLCREWGQECMGMEFAGYLEYVYAEEPSAEKLWDSIVPRLNKRRQLGWYKNVSEMMPNFEP
mmetsp:Transcript_62640/g.73248  ORF Transcript_62640/g.73248 Transcript_62640/m.73248 type:complete len:236 (+) Transcript_62640:108-815(+)